MKLAALAIGLFAVAFLLHWLVWRVRIPRRQTAALLLIFLGTLPVGLVAVSLVPCDVIGPLGFWQYLQVAIFHVSLSFAYIVAYSALEERSPSMTILVVVANAGAEGLAREELEGSLKTVRPVESRLAAMVRDGMVSRVDGRYRLERKGRAWGWVFGLWLRLLNRDKGG